MTTYKAQQTLQGKNDDGSAATTLRVHEDAGDGTPLCHVRQRDWGQAKYWVALGTGHVTCGRCARTRGV